MNSQWLGALRIYLGTTVFAHFIWEILQLPLYTIWNTGTPREIAFAVVHCTAGDLLIAALSLVAALLCFGSPAWPSRQFIPVMAATLVIGTIYTIYSEWTNTVIRKTWAYSELMPLLPIAGTGLSPLVQWLIVPMIGFAALWRWCKRMKP